MTRCGFWLSDGTVTTSTHKAAWDATPKPERRALLVGLAALMVAFGALWYHACLVAFATLIPAWFVQTSLERYPVRLKYFIRMQAARGRG